MYVTTAGSCGNELYKSRVLVLWFNSLPVHNSGPLLPVVVKDKSVILIIT